MKERYYNLINKYNIHDIAILIAELSYSRLYNILLDLLYKFNYDISLINKSLELYKTNYIDLNRVEIYKIRNILIYYCKEYR